MSDTTKSPNGELDPELSEWLADARALDEAAPSADYASMLREVEQDIARAESKPSFWLESRPTWMRRLIASIATMTVLVLGGVVMTHRDWSAISPLHLGVAFGALGVLLGASLHQALRPLQRPPLPRWARIGMGALTLVATFTLAILPMPDTHAAPIGEGLHVSPCLFFGLLMGLPVYLVLRLLDRGTSHAPLLAACAAGLIGNLVLELHCPRTDAPHLMLGHFTVALVFVLGLGAVHFFVRSRR